MGRPRGRSSRHKPGTNEWHGACLRAARVNARFPIENPAPIPQPFTRQNYVATLGGPIARDKVWLVFV
jgi:hypothetical protein